VTHVLVLTAIDVEARGLARHLGLDRVGDSPWPHYRGGRIEIACVGLAAGALAERAARCAAPGLVVSAGACGALAPALAAGDLVVPEAVLDEQGGPAATDEVLPLARAGTLISVTRLVATQAAKARLWMTTGALAVDMESAAIVRWARERGVRAAVVRAVSDTAHEAVPADLAALVEPGGRVRTTAALRAALARPRAIADAVHLGRGTSAALKAVAAALASVARS
jgi:adenosylhomocysteine nucleosidase